MRIDKFISDLGIASRKEAALVAKRGGVTVNGTVKKDLSEHINPNADIVCYLGRVAEYRKYNYVMLNKPDGYVSATEDSKLPVVTDLLSDELRRIEMFPVGRLDKDTVGLMILTNNGVLAHALLSPKRHVSKKYYFESADALPKGIEENFRNGITLSDGYECKSAQILLDEGRKSGIITLTEGKYHQIKRMIAASGSKVTYLERITFGDIPLDKNLKRGEWRFLTEEEINSLTEQVPSALRG